MASKDELINKFKTGEKPTGSDFKSLIEYAEGVDGKDGKDGSKGDPGEDGKDGEQGPQGEPGKDGSDGKDGENPFTEDQVEGLLALLDD